jgi:branched-chain amino acid transport system permease protein
MSSSMALSPTGGAIRVWKAVGIAGAAIMAVTLPLWTASPYVIKTASLTLIMAVISSGLNLIYGYAGLLSFAQVGFWGFGAYASALLAVDLGVSPWLSFPLAGVLTALFAVAIGVPALRVSRASFVIVSLSFSLLLQLLARNWVEVTRGPMGIPGLPAPTIPMPGGGVANGQDPEVFYWIALGFAALILSGVHRLTTGRFGRTLLAINQNEPLAASQGVHVIRYQLTAFAISALITGMAGGLYVFNLTIVEPTIFDPYYMQMMLIIVIVGGAGYFWCVLGASVVFTVLPEILRIEPDLRMVLLGAILVLAIQFLPGGLGGYLEQRRLRVWRRQLG